MFPINKHQWLTHNTKKNIISRFVVIFLIFFVYLLMMSWWHGLSNGILISLLTWSFFVFCTPIADAGFLLDFPIRLFTGLRMIYSELFVWVIAALLNIYAFLFNPSIYDKVLVLQIFEKILLTPFPYWLVIILSAIGTFLSIYFCDELIDVAKHKQRKKFHTHKYKYAVLFVLFIFITIILFVYERLLSQLGIKIW